jgi:hypothetical protein
MNISQIEATTEKIMYFRRMDYSRAVAFTEFLCKLEKKYGDNFRLCTLHPHYICNKSIESKAEMEATKKFVIGLWASWKIGDTDYYMQMDENIFFDAWIARSWKIDKTHRRHEYASRMNELLYAGSNFGTDEKSIAQLIKNFLAAFNETNKRQPDTYVKEIPAYDRKELQTIYGF